MEVAPQSVSQLHFACPNPVIWARSQKGHQTMQTLETLPTPFIKVTWKPRPHKMTLEVSVMPTRSPDFGLSSRGMSTSHRICSQVYGSSGSRCSILAWNLFPIAIMGDSAPKTPPTTKYAFLHSIYIQTTNLQCWFPSILSPTSSLRWCNSERACVKRVLISSYLVSAKPSSLYHFWA